jgi:hypothetical protein
MAGFAVVVLTNVDFPPNVDSSLLVLVGFVTAGVVSKRGPSTASLQGYLYNFLYCCCVVQVGSTLISMLSSTFLLVAVYRYDCYKRKPHSFSEWWASL